MQRKRAGMVGDRRWERDVRTNGLAGTVYTNRSIIEIISIVESESARERKILFTCAVEERKGMMVE